MNKAELIDAMAKDAGLSKADAEKALKAFTNTVSKELKKKGKVQLVGFGTFETSKRAARKGKNPVLESGGIDHPEPHRFSHSQPERKRQCSSRSPFL